MSKVELKKILLIGLAAAIIAILGEHFIKPALMKKA